LLSDSSALLAVLSGFFASAGAYPDVLLGPLSILVGGVGAGARAFDGRLRQPGMGTKRPRGFRDGEPVPAAAYVAVPSAISAIAVAQAYDDARAFGALAKHGVQQAQRAGAEVRAELLQVVQGMGAAGFSDPAFVRPLLHVAGASEGGLLTPMDFAALPTDIDVAAVAHPEDKNWLEVPWAQAGADRAREPSRLDAMVTIVAFDSRGVAAAVSYQRCRDGVALDAMELEAPRAAIPVLRGVTRVAPGERLAGAASMALRFEGGRPIEIVASPGVPRMALQNLQAPELAIRRDPNSRLVSSARR
jgi:gamma-glutamyltranspeptidase/glutathione hydrolase